MPSTSRHKQIADAVVTVIQGLSLSGIASGSVIVYWGVDLKPVLLPAIFVCTAGTKTRKPYTNERDEVGYPISVNIVARAPLDDPAQIDAALVWREAIEPKFPGQRLSGVSFVDYCEYDSGPILDTRLLGYQLLAQPINLRFITHETRG